MRIGLMRLAVASSATIMTLEAFTCVFTPSCSSLVTIRNLASSSVIGAFITATRLGDDETPKRATIPTIATTTIPARMAFFAGDQAVHRDFTCPQSPLKNSLIYPLPILHVL